MTILTNPDTSSPGAGGALSLRSLPAQQGIPDIDLWVSRALRVEVMLTPKPGLVDQANTGSHRDMDLALFHCSIQAISPWFRRFTEAGYDNAHLPLTALLAQVRPIGITCEQAMLSATHGVNTHKGGIFAFGLLCTAAGWLAGQGQRVTQTSLCHSVAIMCQDLVSKELQPRSRAATAGEHLFQRYGLTGARGEAASGFATVTRHALPAYRHALQQGADEETALLRTLLVLMAHNQDTNVVSRGGIEGLVYVQRQAAALLTQPVNREAIADMNDRLVQRNLSPGGSADLLAITWLLFHYPLQ